MKKYGIKKNLILIKLKSKRQLIKYKKKDISKEKDSMIFRLLPYSELKSNLQLINTENVVKSKDTRNNILLIESFLSISKNEMKINKHKTNVDI